MIKDETNAMWSHLHELASRLKVILYSLFITTTIFMVFPTNSKFLQDPFGFYDPVIGLVLRHITNDALPQGVLLIAGEFTAPIEIYMIASVLLGIATSTPIIAYEVYRYIDPALYPEERRAVYPFVASFTVLFIIGVAFGYKILVPFILWGMLPFFRLTNAVPVIYVMDFYNLVFVTVLTTGFSFTLPVFFVLLIKFGIIKTSFVTTRRKYIYAALYIVTAVVTPDGGPLADISLFIPMIILLELAVYFGRRIEKKQGPIILRSEKKKLTYLKCKFCGGLLNSTSSFCPTCAKSQV